MDLSSDTGDAIPQRSGEMPLSIIIVNWNTLDLLRDCLESVYEGLRGQDAQVIVVDNASEDGSADMVSELFPTVELVRNSENRGFAAANNQGFALAHGKYVLLLNSDTLVHGDVLQQSVAYMEAHPQVGGFGCRVLNTDGTVQRTCSMYPSLLNTALSASGLWKLAWPRFFGRYEMSDWQRDSERTVEVVSGCYLMLPRKVIDDVGGLDETFWFFGEDDDWCRRIREAGWELKFAPVGEITHYGSASARKFEHRRDMMLTQAKVRLHRKHSGFAAAAACWALLLLFNSSRALFWSIRSLFGGPAARERAVHFIRITASFNKVWVPAEGGK